MIHSAIKYGLLYAAAIALTPLPATAQNSSAALTRDGAIRTALLNNLELKVADLEIDRARSRLRWAGRLSNPDLELSGSTDQYGLDDDESGFEIAFSQRFPITSRLRKEKIVRQHDVELAEIEFQIRQRQLAFEVDKLWIELRALTRTVTTTSRLSELNREISAFLSRSAKVGEASPLEAVQASLNGKLLEQELSLAEANRADASAKLRRLMGAEPRAAAHPVTGSPFPNSAPPSSLKMATVLRNRPDYLMLLASKELGEAQLDLALSQRWDDIALRVFMESENAVDEPVGLERNTFFGIGLSIPLPLHNRNEQAIDDAKIEIEMTRRARAAKLFAIDAELRRVLRARLAAYDLARSAQDDALPLAKKNLDEFKTAQQDGQASLLQVQRAQSQLLQLENAALDFKRSYDLLDAEVRFIAGTYPIPPPITKKSK